MSEDTKIETAVASHFIKDDILYIVFHQDADVDIDDMLESKKARLKLQKEKAMKVLVDVRAMYQISKEARELSAKQENSELSVAMAILSESISSKLFANFFIKFNKPTTPTKMFTSKEKALKWLNNFNA